MVAYGLILPAGGARRHGVRLFQHSCVAAAALAWRGAHSSCACSREIRPPASPSCAWTPVSTPARCWRRARYRWRRARPREACTIGWRPWAANSSSRRLDAVAAGSVTRRWRSPPPASPTPRSWTRRRRGSTGTDAATAVLRQVRAFNPWPIAETTLAGAQLRIWEAELAPARVQAEPAGAARVAGTVLEVSDEGVDVACGDGVLRMLRMQLPGRKPLAAREFIRAQRLAGSRLGSQ